MFTSTYYWKLLQEDLRARSECQKFVCLQLCFIRFSRSTWKVHLVNHIKCCRYADLGLDVWQDKVPVGAQEEDILRVPMCTGRVRLSELACETSLKWSRQNYHNRTQATPKAIFYCRSLNSPPIPNISFVRYYFSFLFVTNHSEYKDFWLLPVQFIKLPTHFIKSQTIRKNTVLCFILNLTRKQYMAYFNPQNYGQIGCIKLRNTHIIN